MSVCVCVCVCVCVKVMTKLLKNKKLENSHVESLSAVQQVLAATAVDLEIRHADGDVAELRHACEEVLRSEGLNALHRVRLACTQEN